jgi:hypothetical protein
VVSDFVNIPAFDGGPGLPKLKNPETEPDPIDKILNMDEETFRKLFNMPKLKQTYEDQEINEVD